MMIFLKSIFYILIVVLIIISLYPGSLLGYLFYNDLSQQPNIIDNPFGTTINHFISYIFVSLVGFFIYLNNKKNNHLFYFLLVLSIILEVIQFIIPNRSFQISDLLANNLGVIVAYFIVKIYLIFNKNE